MCTLCTVRIHIYVYVSARQDRIHGLQTSKFEAIIPFCADSTIKSTIYIYIAHICYIIRVYFEIFVRASHISRGYCVQIRFLRTLR